MSAPCGGEPRKEVPFVMPSKHARAKKAAKWLLICIGVLLLIFAAFVGFLIFDMETGLIGGGVAL